MKNLQIFVPRCKKILILVEYHLIKTSWWSSHGFSFRIYTSSDILLYLEQNVQTVAPQKIISMLSLLYCWYIFTTQIFWSLIKQYRNYPSSCHVNVLFTIETEQNNIMPFLDVAVNQKDETFTTDVYHKPNFSGEYTHFYGFLPSS